MGSVFSSAVPDSSLISQGIISTSKLINARPPRWIGTTTVLMNTCEIPLELTDIIISHLSGDRTTLLVSSLVCRGFMLSSRRHLFSTVSLRPQDLPSFLALNESPVNAVGPFVAKFALHEFRIDIPNFEHALLNILASRCMFPKMKSLRLTKSNPLPPVMATLSTAFREITELDLHLIEFDHFPDFVEFVSRFTALKTLLFSEVSWTYPTPPVYLRNLKRSFQPSFCLRFLDLHDGNARDVVEWLFAQDFTPSIHTLHFDTHRYEPNHAVRRLIETSGPFIRQLQFELTFANEIDENLRGSVDLGLCTNLRHLHLHNIILLSGFVMTSKIPRWVPTLLTQVSSQEMREVVFTLLVHRNNDIECFDWASVQNSLLLSQFRNLTTVRIRMPGTDSDKVDRVNVERLIRESKLPEIDNRDILRVEFPGY